MEFWSRRVVKKEKFQLDTLLGVLFKYVTPESVGEHQERSGAKRPVYVLNRELYREQTLTLPVMERKALKQAIEFELQGKEEHGLYVVNQNSNNSITVDIYWIAPSLNELTGVLIPESLIIGRSIKEGEFVLYQNGSNLVYLAKNSKGIFSKLSAGMFANAEYFCAAHGIAALEFRHIEVVEFRKILNENWFRLPWHKCMGLWHQAPGSDESLFDRLSKAVFPFSLLFTVYLLLSSAFVSMQMNSASDELSGLKANVGSALKVRNEVRNLDEHLHKLSVVQNAVQTRWELWPVLVPLYEMGSQIERITVVDDLVNIRVRADSSSAVLQNLINNVNVSSAKFSGPARKVRDKEVVNVEVKLAQKVER